MIISFNLELICSKKWFEWRREMEKKYYEGLTQNRKNFVEQVSYLIVNELTEVEKLEEYDSDEVTNTLAIDSRFGMGKTYFSKGLGYYLKNEVTKNSGLKNLEVINYNAWESDFFQDPMKTILYKILSSIDNGSKAEVTLGKAGKKILETCGETFDEVTKIPLFKISSILKNADKIDSLEGYEEYLNLINQTKKVLEGKSIFFNGEYNPKVIIIDELDRCKPNFSIEVLEAVKHFFNIRGLFFVFLINKEQLTKSAENLFGDFGNKESYFQKFFDLEFKLPELDFDEYIEKEYAGCIDTSIYLREVEDGYEIDSYTFSEALFLYLYKNLEHLLDGSVREFKKRFSKFKMLIKTLNSKEREDLTLHLTLTLYYLNKEFCEEEFVTYIGKVRERFEGEKSGGWDSPIYYGKQIEIFDAGFLRVEIDKWYHQIYFRLMEDFEFTVRDRYSGELSRKIGLFPLEVGVEKTEKIVETSNGKIKNLKYYFDANANIAVSLNIEGSIQSGSKSLLEWCEKKYSFLEALYMHK